MIYGFQKIYRWGFSIKESNLQVFKVNLKIDIF